MSAMSHWVASLVLATGLGAAALVPAPARASDELVRVIVDVADVVLRGSTPYYRHGSYGRHDRLIVVHDRYGRPTYYRQVPRNYHVGYRPPHHRPVVPPPPRRVVNRYAGRNSNVYRNHGYPPRGNTNCNRSGRCTVSYYDPRHDRNHRGNRHDRNRRGRGR